MNTVAAHDQSKNGAAFVFPGSGVQYQEIYTTLKDNLFFQRHCQTAGIDGDRLFSEGNLTDDPVEAEQFTQRLLYTICCALCDDYKHHKTILPTVVLGYSMGIYAALYAAEAYTFETGLSILQTAFRLTRNLYTSKQGHTVGMGYILGLSEQDIVSLFAQIPSEMHIAAFNGEHSFVIVGDQEPLLWCLQTAEKLGAFRAQRICTQFGYHTPLLQAIACDFRRFLHTCEIFPLSFPFLSSTTLELSIHPAQIIAELVQNMYSPIRWAEVIHRLFHHYKISRCYEIGPGDSLKKMTRYINRKIKFHQVYGGKDLQPAPFLGLNLPR
ncbi:acyltransferase domain-containing protein [candidate division KSB3 bacterium]|uniref:[acyl-carrier-protein] S-malonyltransferase n=1 Tax=candidate division KSB3 bacterium TaxID=2044937 RepID=A0A9D5JSC0_9BACT|nr:acyltransferase domain-containing protein [candidate division KSB3 bacterium]MBD3323107.1 acyltransferase domain-containing protein [candidate division KSB3 bacterium]